MARKEFVVTARNEVVYTLKFRYGNAADQLERELADIANNERVRLRGERKKPSPRFSKHLSQTNS